MSSTLHHASGSANPASSLSTLWAYLLPALDHIIKAPTNDPNGKAPAIDVGLYAGIHSACYNYFTSQNESLSATVASMFDDTPSPSSGTDIYVHLDKYFAEAVREIALAAPSDDITLIQYLVPSFNRYSAGARSANRLLNYVNRHYVKRAVDEDKGWLRLPDVIESVAKSVTSQDSREVISKRLREKKLQVLKTWGLPDNPTPPDIALAESYAEAASAVDRIVPIVSLAHRRFRTEFVDILLIAPKIKGGSKAKHRIPKQPSTSTGARPKGRLGRAVKDLLESNDIDDDERRRLAEGLINALKAVGIRHDHVLVKKLEKFLRSPLPISRTASESTVEPSND